MDYGKKDAVRISNVLGCAALFSMLFGFVLLLAEKKSAWSGTEYLIAFKIVSLAVFILPVIWGVRKLRRMEIGRDVSGTDMSYDMVLLCTTMRFNIGNPVYNLGIGQNKLISSCSRFLIHLYLKLNLLG